MNSESKIASLKDSLSKVNEQNLTNLSNNKLDSFP